MTQPLRISALRRYGDAYVRMMDDVRDLRRAVATGAGRTAAFYARRAMRAARYCLAMEARLAATFHVTQQSKEG